MVQDLNTIERRTSADDVFDFLFDQINTLQLLPGTRISEVEIARQFQVSRQPVREAFIRLSNLELLLIRPQKATVVRQFSHTKILRARFIRSAVETEVLRRACAKPLGINNIFLFFSDKINFSYCPKVREFFLISITTSKILPFCT